MDGTFNATARNSRLSWLKEDTDKNTCRILSNARCLSEGVDVPALDAILFLHPRKSQIDVVQSVGRVMRRAEGKNMAANFASAQAMVAQRAKANGMAALGQWKKGM